MMTFHSAWSTREINNRSISERSLGGLGAILGMPRVLPILPRQFQTQSDAVSTTAGREILEKSSRLPKEAGGGFGCERIHDCDA